MGRFARVFGPHDPDATYVPHASDEHLADLGEVQMNHATAGDRTKPGRARVIDAR